MLCDMTKGQSLFFLTRDAFLEGLNRNMNFTPTFRIGSKNKKIPKCCIILRLLHSQKWKKFYQKYTHFESDKF